MCRERGRARRVLDFPTADTRRNRECAGRRALRRPDHVRRCARARREDREWILGTKGASYAPRRSALLARLPGGNPVADARMSDAFAAIKRIPDAPDPSSRPKRFPLISTPTSGRSPGSPKRSHRLASLSRRLLVERPTRTENVVVVICVQYSTVLVSCTKAAGRGVTWHRFCSTLLVAGGPRMEELRTCATIAFTTWRHDRQRLATS